MTRCRHVDMDVVRSQMVSESILQVLGVLQIRVHVVLATRGHKSHDMKMGTSDYGTTKRP